MCVVCGLTLLTPGLGLQRTTTAEQSWSYTRDQRSEQVLATGHSVTMYSRGWV